MCAIQNFRYLIEIPTEGTVEIHVIFSDPSSAQNCPSECVPPAPKAVKITLANSKGKLENTNSFPAFYFILNMKASFFIFKNVLHISETSKNFLLFT